MISEGISVREQGYAQVGQDDVSRAFAMRRKLRELWEQRPGDMAGAGPMRPHDESYVVMQLLAILAGVNALSAHDLSAADAGTQRVLAQLGRSGGLARLHLHAQRAHLAEAVGRRDDESARAAD